MIARFCKISSLLAAICLIVVAAAIPLLAAQINVTCSPTKMKIGVSQFSLSGTNSTTFKTMPEGTVSFTQGGTSASCIVVRFSASTVSNNDFMVVRPFLDNTTTAIPAEIEISGFDGNAARAHTYEFVFPSVAPGSHVLRMQYRTRIGNAAAMNQHTTVVQHAP
jgi:hypothetical protein